MVHWTGCGYGANSVSSLHFRNRLKRDTKLFFSRLLNPDISHGAADYYVIMLFFDVLCFITIIFGISSFGVSCHLCVCMYI